jgi:hypothetical protein
MKVVILKNFKIKALMQKQDVKRKTFGEVKK